MVLAIFRQFCWIIISLYPIMTIGQVSLVFGDSSIGEKGIVSEQLEDGTIWVVGTTVSGPIGGTDVLAVRIDTLGNFLSPIYYYGTTDLDYPNNMVYRDGLLIVAGETHDANGVDGFILQIDTSGAFVAFDQYGMPNKNEQFYDIELTQDGGFVVVGLESSANTVGTNFLLSKFDSKLLQAWSKVYDLGTNEVAVAVLEQPNGGYVIAGDQLQATGNYNVAMLGCDSQGNQLWQKVVSNPNNGGCKQMAVVNNQLVIVGEMSTATSTAFDLYLIRTDWQGNVLFQTTIPKTDNGDAAFDIEVRSNNELYLTGYVFDSVANNTNLIVIAVDTIGQVLGQQLIGNNGFDMGYDIKLLANNHFLVTGFSSESDNQIYVGYDTLAKILVSTTQLVAPHAVIFPNPTHDRLYLSNALQSGFVTIFDRLGQPLLHREINANFIQLHELPSGIYTCVFSNEEQQVIFRQQIIKL